MEARIRHLEVQLAELTASLSRLEAEVVALRAQSTPAAPVPELVPAVAAPSPPASEAPRAGAARVLALLGQSFLALGGAFLLRALSDAHSLSVPVGASLALAFAWLWSGATLRALGSGDRLAGYFRAATGACIAYPLLAETSLRGDLPAPVASLVLVAFTVTLLLVARRAGEVGIAWLGVGCALGVCVVQVMASSLLGYVVTTLVALLLVTLWTEGSAAWAGLRWPVVLLADVFVLRLGNSMQQRLPIDLAQPAAFAGLAGLLTAAPLAWVVWRRLAKGEPEGWFGWTQVPLAAAIGLVSAAHAAGAMGFDAADLAWVSGLLSAGIYGAALLDGARGDGAGVPYLSSLAVVLALLGGILSGGGAVVGLVGCGLGILSVGLGQRTRRTPLVLQGSIYLWLGAWAAGTLPAALAGFSGAEAGVAWPSLLAGGALCVFGAALGARPGVPLGDRASWIRGTFLLLLLLLLDGALLDGLARLLPGAEAARLLRLAILSGTALLLALGSRLTAATEWVALSYVALGLGGLALVAEDLTNNSALGNVAAFALFGLALIASPRLVRRPAGPGSRFPPVAEAQSSRS